MLVAAVVVAVVTTMLHHNQDKQDPRLQEVLQLHQAMFSSFVLDAEAAADRTK
jgi:hypothetical protein